MARNPNPTEHVEQTKLVARVRSFYPDVIIAAVPNGGSRDVREAVKLKAEGVLAGFPDLIVAEPRGRFHGLYVEMKRRKAGRLEPDQREMLARLRARGYKTIVGRGVDDAWVQVEEYLNLPPWPAASPLD